MAAFVVHGSVFGDGGGRVVLIKQEQECSILM